MTLYLKKDLSKRPTGPPKLKVTKTPVASSSSARLEDIQGNAGESDGFENDEESAKSSVMSHGTTVGISVPITRDCYRN